MKVTKESMVPLGTIQYATCMSLDREGYMLQHMNLLLC